MTPITIMSKAMTATVKGRLRATWTSHIINVKQRYLRVLELIWPSFQFDARIRPQDCSSLLVGSSFPHCSRFT